MTVRTEAAKRGQMTYNTGKPCRNGHTTDRYTSGGMCIGCLHDQREKFKAARRDQNTFRFQGAMPVPALIKEVHKSLLYSFTAVLRYADATTIEELRAYITMLEGNIKK